MPQPQKSTLPEIKLLTVAEVAVYFRVSKMTVYRMIVDGDLPALKIGRNWRIDQRHVELVLRGGLPR